MLQNIRTNIQSFLANPFISLSAGSNGKSSSTLGSNSKANIGQYDIVIIGGGIVGCATARELSNRNKNFKMALIDKEEKLGAHQSGHNSGVIHAGIYYTPNTLKAKLCVAGFHKLYEYLKEKNIPFKKCGKLIVAVDKSELDGLNKLLEKGIKNKVQDLKLIGPDEIKNIEPKCSGLKAIWSPHTGIVDYGKVTQEFAKDFECNGGNVHLNFQVNQIKVNDVNVSENKYPICISSKKGECIQANYVVTACGLYSDKIAQMTGCDEYPKIVPFRGEYLTMKPKFNDIVKCNIYPVPDSRFPFLGVHFTPRIDGSLMLGPNAVLAFKREGYSKLDFNFGETFDALTSQGLRSLIFKYFWPGIQELYRSFRTKAQVAKLAKYVPELEVSQVQAGPAGVRAQALDKQGNLVEDFVFDSGKDKFSKHVLHVRNAPSPAATSSMAIAEMIADKVEQMFKIQ